MNPRLAIVAAAMSVVLAACSSDTEPTSAAPTAPSPTAAARTSTTPAPRPSPAARPARAPICPAKPAANGPLTDQGEQVGRIGLSSQSFKDKDRPGLHYCIAVVSARRTGPVVIVAVKVVNNGGVNLNLDGDDQMKVRLSYGTDGEVAAQNFDVDVQALVGTLPAGQSLTGRYAFTVPAGRQRVTVSAGPTLSDDQGAWVGTTA